MALIQCPSCTKKISSMAAVCSHCSTVVAEMSEEQRINMKQMTSIEKSAAIMTQSMLAMLLFCGGFGFMFWGQPEPESWQNTLASGTAVVGFVWYIINRVRLLILKRK
ncbi:hypothetical protein AADZ86_05110 [Colwelliaceae bacterium BS250]